jgi:ubiquinone/menaquinone biosynthesis C-methylase UbiE
VATDVRQIVANLAAFYDFTDRTVVAVGAGGGQLVEYARPCRQVIAVDKDETAILQLSRRATECGLSEKYSILRGDFLSMEPRGDVVLFEFCLHEMDRPDAALAHARKLAPDVLIIDHAPSSPWSWYADEDVQVQSAWDAVWRKSVRRQQTIEASQQFREFAELEDKLASRGPTSLDRIVSLRRHAAFSIPMPYVLALL